MSINIDSALGIHAEALRLRERRTEVLASNLANADTPGFKAQDLDFKAVLANETGGGLRLASTHARHLPAATPGSGAAPELLYRVPTQSSLDGNTVDPHLEKAAFSDNAMRYQTTLMLLGSKVSGLSTAIKGK